MEYLIMEFPTTRELVKNVNIALADGWKPIGAVSIAHKIEQSWSTGDLQYWISHQYLQTLCRED
jgi:hypothetical protein